MNDVVQSHYVGVLQIPQQRHCKQHATFTQNLWGGSLGVFYPYLLQDPRCTLGEGRQASRQPSNASTRHYCMTPSFPIQIWNLYRKSMHT